jgi:thiosulfate/3-mercaptopyruvate sulfurtransferase
MTRPSPLISAAALRETLAATRIVLVDARAGADAGSRYEHEHLPGALFVDLERDLSIPPANAAEGGRHPLPSIEAFAALLARLGIGAETHVVVYDDKNGANAAARFWWMLRSAGHAKVQVLDGGLQAALAAGIAPVSGVERATPTEPMTLRGWQLPIATVDEVRRASLERSVPIVDVREHRRFLGEIEPIDTIAGHIPGAVNLPYTENLDDAGRFLSADVLRAQYAAALEGAAPEDVIVHCGSGVTACHTLLAFEHAGLPVPRLYVGSWSEWSRRGLPVGTGE